MTEDSFDAEQALVELIVADVFFIFDTKNVFLEGKDEKPGTITLELNCNDLWYWATADSEPVTVDELPELYRRFKEDKKWGTTKYACVKRKLAPQVPVVKQMQDDGAWDDEMGSLPTPSPS